MIDFHSHVLPGIDDGSRDAEETLQLLHMEYQQGVRTLIATPHFYGTQDLPGHFLERRAAALKKTEEMISNDPEVPRLLVGAEVYYFPGIGRAKMLPQLCIQGTRVLLLEMPFCQWTHEMAKEVEGILKERGLIVMLAHVDRYYGFQKNRDAWRRIMELPLYTQLNGEAFLRWKTRRFALNHVSAYRPTVLGSDCHNTVSRPPNLQAARMVIGRKLGQDTLDKIDILGKQLLG